MNKNDKNWHGSFFEDSPENNLHMNQMMNHLQSLISEIVKEAVTAAMERHAQLEEEAKAQSQHFGEVLNVDQAAAFLHIAKPTLYAMTSQRKIPFYKNGKRVLFKRKELEAWLSEGKRDQIGSIKERSSFYINQKPLNGRK